MTALRFGLVELAPLGPLQHRVARADSLVCPAPVRRGTSVWRRSWPPRSLAGKPLAGFYATPIRRITVLCGTVVHVLR